MTSNGVDNGPAYQKVAGAIRDMIVSGELSPGDRLPVEADLAERFDVSRSTVREALRVISSQDLVTTTRGVTGGTFVKQQGTGNVTETFEVGLGLLAAGDGVTVDELLEVREILEVPATRIAARRITPEVLRDLERSIEPKGADNFDHHRTFHEILTRATGNRLLEVVTNPIFEVLRTRFLRDTADDDLWADVADDHRLIVDAIRSGDEDRAAEAMLSHLRKLRTTYLTIDRERLR